MHRLLPLRIEGASAVELVGRQEEARGKALPLRIRRARHAGAVPQQAPRLAGVRVRVAVKIGGRFLLAALLLRQGAVAHLVVILNEQAVVPVVLHGRHHLIQRAVRRNKTHGHALRGLVRRARPAHHAVLHQGEGVLRAGSGFGQAGRLPVQGEGRSARRFDPMANPIHKKAFLRFSARRGGPFCTFYYSGPAARIKGRRCTISTGFACADCLKIAGPLALFRQKPEKPAQHCVTPRH